MCCKVGGGGGWWGILALLVLIDDVLTDKGRPEINEIIIIIIKNSPLHRKS